MSVIGRSFPRPVEVGLDLRLLAPVFSTVFVGMLWWVGFRPFVSQAAGDTGSSVPVVGQVLTLGALISALAGLFAGPLADHYGQRRSILIGLSLLSLGATLIALASHIVVLALGGLVGGLGMAMTYGVAFAVVATHLDGRARRQAMGMTQAAASIAIVAGVPALVLVATLILWRGAFLLLAAAMLVALLVAARLLPPDRRRPGRCASPRAILSTYRPLATGASTRQLYLLSLLRSFVISGLAIYAGAYYQEILGFSARQVGIAFMLEGGGSVLGNLAGGGRLGSLDQRRTFAIGSLLIGAGALTIYTLRPEPYLVVALAMGMAFVAGITFTSITAMLAGERTLGPATTMVLNISTIALGAALGSATGGLLIRIGGYELIGIAALGAMAAVAALAIGVRRSKETTQQPA
ncbi:MAG TPA: MFS transporter [Thermomicrobiales bacterium]|nr:MFS transporter [Thermomicrobiales bacterium]